MTPLSINDQALYRLYAVGLLTYEQALKQAESEVRLRRAMLHFDSVARAQQAGAPSPQAAAPSQPRT